MELNTRKIAEGHAAARLLMGLALPGLTAYKVKRLADCLKDVAAAYETARQAIVKQYGIPAEDAPGAFRIMPEHAEAFDSAIKELDEALETITPPSGSISVKDLAKVELPGSVFEALDWWITDE